MDPPGSGARGVLARAGRLYARHLGWIAGLSALTVLPELVQAPGFEPGLAMLSRLASGVATATLLVVLRAHDEGAPLPPHRALGRGAVAYVEAMFPLMEMVFVSFWAWLLVIPGIWLLARWALAWPVAVLEGRGLDAAAERSEGRRWLLLGLCWGPWLATMAVVVVVMGLLLAAGLGPLASALAFVLGAYPWVVTYVCWRDLRAPQ